MAAGQSQNTGSSGCSIVVVAIITALSGVLGFIAGAGTLYGFIHSQDDALERLGLTKAIPEKPQPAPAEAEDSPDDPGDQVYPLAYPIQETLRIQGDIDKQMVIDKVANERFDLAACYKEEIADNPKTKGEMSLQITVAHRSGKVMAAVARENMTGSDSLEKCILDEMKSWSFDAEKVDNGLAVVRFDALFIPLTSENAPRP
jgi:hypothetical protein